MTRDLRKEREIAKAAGPLKKWSAPRGPVTGPRSYRAHSQRTVEWLKAQEKRDAERAKGEELSQPDGVPEKEFG